MALPYLDNTQQEIVPILGNPSVAGNYSHLICYAALEQKINPYPGQHLMTAPTVDDSELLEGWNFVHNLQQGFGPDALPLNGQVWMPEGPGPFPLVLIVHGNYNSGDRSDGTLVSTDS